MNETMTLDWYLRSTEQCWPLTWESKGRIHMQGELTKWDLLVSMPMAKFPCAWISNGA